jgi:polyisoprenoid-binding protein YceI
MTRMPSPSDLAVLGVPAARSGCHTNGKPRLHGVTGAVELEVEFLGVVDDPSGAERIGFSAMTTISRAAFGVDIQLGFGGGNVVVVDTIEIEFTGTGPAR